MNAPRLTREQLLAGQTEEVLLPEMGGTVIVRGLTRAEIRSVRERAGLGADVSEPTPADADLTDNLFVVYGLADPPLLVGADIDGAVAAVKSLPAGTVARLVARILWLSGMRGWVVPEGQTEAVPAGPFPGGAGDDDQRGDVPGAPDSP